ncbi:MAG: hypothetical protein RRX95_07595, partial [Oscillospiraceae bacterium]
MKDSSKDIKAEDLPQENQKESPRGNLEDASRDCQKENPRSRSDERNCDSAQAVPENSITETPPKNQKPNLYSSAKVSVKVLDMAIV